MYVVRFCKKGFRYVFHMLKLLIGNIRLIPFYVHMLRKIDRKTRRVPVRSNNPSMKVRVRKAEGARIELDGELRFESFLGDTSSIDIVMEKDSKLLIHGDLILGSGTKIYLRKGAMLELGGKSKESGSGFTGNSRIMVAKRISIGTDFLCAWNAFITDCDWHHTESGENWNETVIGDHVWVTPNCSILKGSKIGNNCIVATGSVLTNKCYPDQSLVGGSPAKVLKSAAKWTRDLSFTDE